MINDFFQIGRNINKQLISKSISRQELADNLGIPESMVDKIIEGKKAINVKELAKIADLLGTTVTELLEMDDTSNYSLISQRNFDFIDAIIDEINLLNELGDVLFISDCEYLSNIKDLPKVKYLQISRHSLYDVHSYICGYNFLSDCLGILYLLECFYLYL